MGSLRIVCLIALIGLAGIAANVEWSRAGLAQESKAVAAPAIRRVLTGHDAGNVAKVIDDAPATNSRRGASGSTSTLIWSTDRTPADISAGEKIDDMGVRIFGTSPPRNGSRFVVIDYPPGNRGVMHRTETIDYVVVMSGEIDMEMDASTVKLKAGDVLVQRGTHHAWHNRGTMPARLAFVLIDAKPLGIGHPRP
jgi:mannose-6-phosphate isomerase-like protein (cupin superfamily)